ncbi:MAG: SDR family oxidoreductase [Anaerolineae bacterium]|nr:SDR family oxidoreductase [Anaerolineae bacterium]
MTATILVTGAPGNVGSEVVKGLIGKAAFQIGAYNVESTRKAFGSDQDIVRFDFLDSATYGPAFARIEAMFLVRPPALSNVKRDIAPALIAAQQAGVKHIVFLSLQGVEQNRIVPHYKIEKLILELGFAYTFLRASFFMQNLSTTHLAEIRDKSEIGVPVGRAKTSFIDVRDIAAVAVRALTEDGHANKIYTLTGSEALDYYQVSQTMTDVLGRPVRYTNPSVIGFLRDQLAAGRPLGYSVVMAGLYTITRLGNAKDVTGDVSRILGREPIPFRQFVHDYQACWQAQ